VPPRVQRQRHAVKPLADFAHDVGVGAGDSEVGPGMLGTFGEQLDRLVGKRQRRKHPPPRHPSPADAVALRHWYSLCAAGAWVRNDGTESSRGYGETAVAMAAAANFWMPPGQVHGYLDSDPITEQDLARIRLAYPNVFLALGKPIVLEADPTPDRWMPNGWKPLPCS
jgi:hypothetical protein